MKIKLTLKTIRKTDDDYNEEDFDTLVSTDDKLINHEFTEETNSILLLKIALSEKLNCFCDSIDLWYKPSEFDRIIELKDIDKISSLSFTNSLYETVIYYQCLTYPIAIVIDFKQNELHTIKLEMSITCSIIMLKYIIEHQLINNSYINRNNQKLYGVSIKTSNSSQNAINSDEELSNDLKLIDLIKQYKDCLKREYISENIILILMLVINDKTKQQIMNETFVSKQNEADETRMKNEYSNGLNLIYQCNNYQCKKDNSKFIQRKGYGKCNIIRETIMTACPQCQSSLFVELEDVGIVNGKWALKGLLNIQKPYSFEGEGITKIPNKIHLIPDLKISKNYSQLLINILPKKTNSKCSLISKNETLASFSDSINQILSKTQSFKEIGQIREKTHNNKSECKQIEEKEIQLQNDNSHIKLIQINTQNEEHEDGCCLLNNRFSCVIY